ncbi:RecB family exonuclease, partial [Nocardioides stalactiti]|uniref:RecB family exonuclease n=1 Tax=Nocardioides stalactiti TaxID=2755356 RepID=UPI00160310AB
PDDDGEQPSRFLDELGHPVQHRVGRPRRPLSMPGLVAELRRTAADPAQPAPLREAAAARLRLLATTQVHGRSVASGADPGTWWGLRSPSRSVQAVRPEGKPVTLSASALEGLLTCPAQWFLDREAGGAVVSTASQGFGKVVHALAERVAKGELAATTVADLMPHVDEVWDRMEFRTPWSRAREREAVEQVLARFLAWHQRPGARAVVALEPRIKAEVTLPDGQVVALSGYADRLELDEAGQVVVVDLKTGKYPPTDKSLPENPQLGLYQLAVDHGAADHLVGRPVTAGGAELVQLRHGDTQPKVQQQPASPPHIESQLQQAVAAVRTEAFVARPGTHCDRCAFTTLCPAFASGSVLS